MRKLLTVFAVLVLLSGLVLAVYPFVKNAFYSRMAEKETENFREKARETGAEETEDSVPYEELLEAALQYNRELWENSLSGLTEKENYRESCLELADYGIGDGIFAVISIPSLELELPVFLGASAEHLSAGAAQLCGTGLPVGGINTNCVIAGHRSWQSGMYFHDIVDLEEGDEVYITNFWGTLCYEVTELKTVGEYDSGCTEIRENRDLLTLLTCCYPSPGVKARYAVICERKY